MRGQAGYTGYARGSPGEGMRGETGYTGYARGSPGEGMGGQAGYTGYARGSPGEGMGGQAGYTGYTRGSPGRDTTADGILVGERLAMDMRLYGGYGRVLSVAERRGRCMGYAWRG